jgi:hypothetical protein
MFRNRQILILNNRIAAERWPDKGKSRTERTGNPAGFDQSSYSLRLRQVDGGATP